MVLVPAACRRRRKKGTALQFSLQDRSSLWEITVLSIAFGGLERKLERLGFFKRGRWPLSAVANGFSALNQLAVMEDTP
ncbi:hypothetical protein ACE6H2_002494 [Prunus campanulata]